MKLKQPAIPGVWGPWDPVEGQPKAREAEWPQYTPIEVGDAPLSQQPLSSMPETHASATNTDSAAGVEGSHYTQVGHGEILSSQEQIPTPAFLRESRRHSQPQGSQPRASLPKLLLTGENEISSSRVPPPQLQKKAALKSIDSLQDITKDLGLPSIPSPPSHVFSARREPAATATDPTEIDQPRNTQPAAPPKHFNDSTDLERDEHLKRVASDGQTSHGNGPMWGIGSRPPISFDGSEDFSGLFSGNASAETGRGREQTAQGLAGQGAAGGAAEQRRVEENEPGDDWDGTELAARGLGEGRAKSRLEGRRRWLGQGSIWNL